MIEPADDHSSKKSWRLAMSLTKKQPRAAKSEIVRWSDLAESLPPHQRYVCQTCDGFNSPFVKEDWSSHIDSRSAQRVGLKLKHPRPGRLQWKSKHSSAAFNTVVSDDPVFYRKFEQASATKNPSWSGRTGFHNCCGSMPDQYDNENSKRSDF